MKKGFVSVLLTVVVVYSNLTTLEWLVHKYVMHAYDRPNFPILGPLIESESVSHWDHHHEVKSDMSLAVDEKEDKHVGLFFHYRATFIFSGVLFVLLFLQFRMLRLRVDCRLTCAIGVLSTVVYSFLWNNFHALLHGTDTIILPKTSGVPNTYQNTIVQWIPRSWFNWMMLNHAQHHAVKGPSKGNYNIILPGFDYVMRTHNNPPCFDNTKFCEDSDIGACDKPKGCFRVDGTKLLVKFPEH